MYVLLFLGNDFLDNDIRRHRLIGGQGTQHCRPYRADTTCLDSIVYLGTPRPADASWVDFRRQRSTGFRQIETYGIRHYLSIPELNGLEKAYYLTYTSRLVHVLGRRLDGLRKAGDGEDARPQELRYTAWDLRILECDLRSIIRTADSHRAGCWS